MVSWLSSYSRIFAIRGGQAIKSPVPIQRGGADAYGVEARARTLEAGCGRVEAITARYVMFYLDDVVFLQTLDAVGSAD